MLIDDWGNEYATEEEATEGLKNIFRSMDDYCNIIADKLDVPLWVMNWIVEKNLFPQFAKDCKNMINEAESEWIDYYLCEMVYLDEMTNLEEEEDE